MAKVSADDLGTQSIGSLLIKQAVPASIGILIMSLNIIVDTIFVGNWIGSIAIAAINVVLPVSFFIAALGMAIGIGGSSIISRALGAGDKEKALKSFGNQLSLTLLLTIILVVIGLAFVEQIIPRFGGKGGIYEPAKTYYTIVLYGVPFLALCMMGNNVIRAEGKPKFAMIAMIIPSVGNLILDYILIYVFDFGMAGAAWATTLSYLLCFGYILWFFLSENSELHINFSHFNLSKKITSEIASLGSVTLARQAVVSVIYLFMNNILFNLGGESSVAVFGIIARIMMFALFPVLGITQGFLPIAGYNYGARNFSRVKETINTSVIYASGLAVVIFIFLMVFTESIVSVFTKDQAVINQTVYAMKWVFLAVPIVSIQLIGSAYFQAIGKAVPALLLTLSRQGFFFLPLVLILPYFYGEFGVWISFALADFLSTLLTAYFINREVRLKLSNP